MGWLRKILLKLYVDGILQKTYESDGTRNTIDIKFEVSKDSVGNPNESTVVLGNASPKTKSFFLSLTNKQKVTVELFVGYENEGLFLLSRGDLIKLFPERQGSQDSFTLTYLDAFEAICNAHLEREFPGGTSIEEIILVLANSYKNYGVQVNRSKIHVDGNIGKRTFTVSGKTSQTLDQLASSYNFTWSIQDGVFQAYNDKIVKNPGKAVYNVSVAHKNLLKATPELGEKYMQQIGMKIEAILNPKCRCGDIIHLESGTYPSYNGDYEIFNLQFNGGTKDVDWKMTIDSKTIVK